MVYLQQKPQAPFHDFTVLQVQPGHPLADGAGQTPHCDPLRLRHSGGPSILLKSPEMNSVDFKVLAPPKRLYAAFAAAN